MYAAIHEYFSDADAFDEFFWECSQEVLEQLESACNMRDELNGDDLGGLTFDMMYAVNEARQSNDLPTAETAYGHEVTVEWLEDNLPMVMRRLRAITEEM